MERIKVMLEAMGFRPSPTQWDNLQAAIDEARPGEDDIQAALDDLAVSLGEHTATILLGIGGWSYIGVGGKHVASCPPNSSPVVAIRNLILPPVPTPKEDCDTIGCVVVLGSKAHHALERLRKLIPEQ